MVENLCGYSLFFPVIGVAVCFLCFFLGKAIGYTNGQRDGQQAGIALMNLGSKPFNPPPDEDLPFGERLSKMDGD